MSSFTNPLYLEALNDETRGRGEFLVYVPFAYEVGWKGSGVAVNVQQGFKTDLASVPWFARAFIPIAGRCAKPALVHDWMISNRHLYPHWTKKDMDRIFREALRVNGVSPLVAQLMYLAVRTRP